MSVVFSFQFYDFSYIKKREKNVFTFYNHIKNDEIIMAF
ncbi:Uncharacterized protein dnm_012640 [Desulfonema magnum]|uniref:Uncharacterized protein n=1 Tax=Desulfonema magnum TaxID=45655 RepID=A0A975GL39_9BACT|nr:Uncharacterized protein dnm_012640 [Desulfonema magnum]